MTRATTDRRILVGVDGSANSLAALRHAADEAVRTPAVLEVVHVVDRQLRGDGRLGDVLSAARATLRDSVAKVLGEEPPCPVTVRAVVGVPADVLPRLADRAELLVLGTRSHPDHYHPLGGQTVPAVLANSPCEVVLCADHEVTKSAATMQRAPTTR